MSMMQSGNVDPAWKELYKVGGGSLIISGVLLFAAFANFAVGVSEPTDPVQYVKTCATSNTNLLAGGIFTVLFLLFIPGILGLYAALKQAKRAYAVIATGFVFGGIVIFLTEVIATIASIQLSQSYAPRGCAASLPTRRCRGDDCLLGRGRTLGGLCHLLGRPSHRSDDAEGGLREGAGILQHVRWRVGACGKPASGERPIHRLLHRIRGVVPVGRFQTL